MRWSSQYSGRHYSIQRRSLCGGRAHLRRLPYIAELQIGFEHGTIAGRGIDPLRLSHRLSRWILSFHRSRFSQRLPQILI